MSQFDQNPPTFGEPDFAEPRPGWPTGLGIFSIVWGSLGVLCGGCTVASTFAQGPMLEWAAKMQAQAPQTAGAPAMPTGPIPAELHPGAMQVLSAVIHPLGGIILLVAGILLCMRRPVARMTHLVYAAVSLLGTIVGVMGVMSWVGSFRAFEAAQPDHEWVAYFNTFSNPSMMVAQTIGAAFVSLLFPVFVIIWFGMVKKRPEDMGAVAPDQYV
ncbi:MAG: hypothetical protein KF869_03335 [Phycisphaeraceae bacterium]|nr:hypothetical protein [Phycisphaeraceae bacterium]